MKEAGEENSYRYETVAKSYGVQRPGSLFLLPFNPLSHIAYDLSHAGPEGEGPKYFQFLTLIIVERYPNFWQHFSNALNDYLVANHLPPVGQVTGFVYWDKSLNMQAKMTCLLVSPLLLAIETVCPQGIREEFEHHFVLWDRFVQILRILTKHKLSASDLRILEEKIPTTFAELAQVYDCMDNVATINTHYFMHFPEFVKRAGAPREYWTFSGEKEIGGYKRRAVNTNYRSICTSIFRNQWLYLILTMHLSPKEHMPSRFKYSGIADIAYVDEHIRSMFNVAGYHLPDDLLFFDNFRKGTSNYLEIARGTIVRTRVGDYGQVDAILSYDVEGDAQVVIVMKDTTVENEKIKVGTSRRLARDRDILGKVECLHTGNNTYVYCREVESLEI
jgi:hypothetical protein